MSERQRPTGQRNSEHDYSGLARLLWVSDSRKEALQRWRERQGGEADE